MSSLINHGHWPLKISENILTSFIKFMHKIKRQTKRTNGYQRRGTWKPFSCKKANATNHHPTLQPSLTRGLRCLVVLCYPMSWPHFLHPSPSIKSKFGLHSLSPVMDHPSPFSSISDLPFIPSISLGDTIDFDS